MPIVPTMLGRPQTTATPTGADKDCNGIKGDGANCTRTVYFYTKGGDVCDSMESSWPEDIFMIDADDPVGVPNGYVLVGQSKMFRDGEAENGPFAAVSIGLRPALLRQHMQRIH